jgi:signal transduction histidine kinase
LWFRLIVGLVAVSLLAVAAASVGLYLRYEATNSQFREQTLRNQAQLITQYLTINPDNPVQLPSYLTEQFKRGTGKYAIVDYKGALLAASPGAAGPLSPINRAESRHYFILQPEGGSAAYYGLSVKAEHAQRPVWVQVAFVASDIVFDSVLEDFVKDIGWIWIPFVIVLLVVNLVVARIGLAPLHTAASEAATIGPRTTSVRLTEEGLPRDVHALVTAVNRALDRLEEALDSQRHFISDAAHELRTPVSILKAHAAILPDVKEHATLVEEINALERLVNQLLDSARLDVLELRPDQIADLNDVAKEVATQLGPTAINAGRSIEVVACDEPVRISGARDYLCQALRNIVENAIRHTPESTTVRIEVTLPPAISVTDHGPGVPPDNREAIFKRFWQGRDSRGGGAGLGMEIAARTAAAHGGTISVDDAPGGGAIFTMRFRAWTGN